MPEEKSKSIPENILSRIEEYDRNLDRWSYYDLLYIPRNADKAMVKKGYYKIVQLMHPDRYGLELEEKYKQKLERIFNEINIAYNTLMDDTNKSKYDQSLYYAEDHEQPIKVSNDVMVAKAQYSRGVKALRENEIVTAIEFFRSAVDLDPEKVDYFAKLAFALAKHKLPRIRREAIEQCKKAISMQNENANHHALMGFIYQQLGEPHEAKVHYRRALSWDPQHLRSKQEIQKITQEEMNEKKRGSVLQKFKNIFGPSPSKKPPETKKNSARKNS